jgi:hypothetical protein
MSAFPGDEVYFRHGKEPKSGKVLSSGTHGCVVDHGGKQHKLKWEHVLGHKKRSNQQFKIEEHGEDGLIVRDKTGKRRFVAIPKDAKDEQLELSKSLQAGDELLLKSNMKGVIVGRPGKDGAHVRDASGAIHKVLWRDMS